MFGIVVILRGAKNPTEVTKTSRARHFLLDSPLRLERQINSLEATPERDDRAVNGWNDSRDEKRGVSRRRIDALDASLHA